MPTEIQLATLTAEEDTFALAVVEFGGNVAAAYRAAFGSEASFAIAKGREMISRPEIAKRVMELTKATDEHALISLGSHLMQLASIRDIAVEHKQLKVAFSAEKARGEAAGYYKDKVSSAKSEAGGHATINIRIGSSPGNLADWSTKHGKPPVVIDV
jgi:hypothetical protein